VTLMFSRIYRCVTTEKHRTEKENEILRKGLAEQKAKIRENINDLNLSRAVQFEESAMAPQVEFDHRGAQGGTQGTQGTQWNQLEHVTEEPVVVVDNHNQLGVGGGRDWRELIVLANQQITLSSITKEDQNEIISETE
jgi:hypothetical protein